MFFLLSVKLNNVAGADRDISCWDQSTGKLPSRPSVWHIGRKRIEATRIQLLSVTAMMPCTKTTSSIIALAAVTAVDGMSAESDPQVDYTPCPKKLCIFVSVRTSSNFQQL